MVYHRTHKPIDRLIYTSMCSEQVLSKKKYNGVQFYAVCPSELRRGTEISTTNHKSERLLAVHCLHAVGIVVMNDTAIYPLLSLALLVSWDMIRWLIYCT